MRRNGRRVARRRRSPGRSHHDADQRRSLVHPPIAPSRHRAIAPSRHRSPNRQAVRHVDPRRGHPPASSRHVSPHSLYPHAVGRAQHAVGSTSVACGSRLPTTTARGALAPAAAPGAGASPLDRRAVPGADLKWKWPITKHKQPHSLFPILCARHAAISKAYTSSSCTVRLMTLWTLLQVRWTTPIRQPIDRSLSHLPSPPIPSAGLSARLQRRRRPQREARPQ